MLISPDTVVLTGGEVIFSLLLLIIRNWLSKEKDKNDDLRRTVREIMEEIRTHGREVTHTVLDRGERLENEILDIRKAVEKLVKEYNEKEVDYTQLFLKLDLIRSDLDRLEKEVERLKTKKTKKDT